MFEHRVLEKISTKFPPQNSYFSVRRQLRRCHDSRIFPCLYCRWMMMTMMIQFNHIIIMIMMMCICISDSILLSRDLDRGCFHFIYQKPIRILHIHKVVVVAVSVLQFSGGTHRYLFSKDDKDAHLY